MTHLPNGALLRGSNKSGILTSGGMNRFSIAKRIALLGESIGIDGLSPMIYGILGQQD